MTRYTVTALIIFNMLFVVACGNDSGQQADNSAVTDKVSEQLSGIGKDIGEATQSVQNSMSDGIQYSENQLGEVSNNMEQAVDGAKQSMSETAEAAKDKLAGASEMVGEKIEGIGTTVAENASELKDSASRELSNAQGSISDIAEATNEKAREFGAAMSDSVENAGDKLAAASGDLSGKAAGAGEKVMGNAALSELSRSTDATVNESTQGASSNNDAIESTAALVKDQVNEIADQAALTPITSYLEKITFRHDSSDISDQSVVALDRLINQLQNQPTAKVEILGYTDNLGPDEYNQMLSLQRATLVKDYLVSKGLSTDNLLVKGVGSDNPIGDNLTAEGRRANRRVELKIVN